MHGLRVVIPTAPLKEQVSAFYLFESDAPVIDEMERAGGYQLRFILSGKGEIHFADGARCALQPAMLIGPRLRASRLFAEGPLRMFGIGLRPAGWASLTDQPAAAFLECACDANALAPDLIQSLQDALQGATCLEDMMAAAQRCLLAKKRPVPANHGAALDIMEAWLTGSLDPAREQLTERLPMSSRQIARLTNHYWGAPPRTLARTLLALRTAAHIVSDQKIPQDGCYRYADASHLIREVRRVTGYTPRELLAKTNELARNLLDLRHFIPNEVEG